MFKGYSHTPGRVYACLLALFLSFSWTSCSKELTSDEITDQALAGTESSIQTEEHRYCKTQSYCLTAGQTIESGSVIVKNDQNNLYITVQSTGGFQSTTENIKIWVGDDQSLLPVSGNGTPIPGQFPFKYDATGNSFTATIPFSSITGSCAITCSTKLYIFVHVDIIDPSGTAQTAWGGCVGKNIDKPGRWYYFDTYQGSCCTCGCPPTAVAKGSIIAN